MGDGVSVGEMRSKTVANLTTEDFVKYAGASGDFNPMHYDHELATAAGQRDVFAPGMLTAGIAAALLSEWFGIAAIRSFRVRFQSQVWRGDSVTTEGEVTKIFDDQGERISAVAIEATTQNGDLVLNGDATVVLGVTEV